jgi:hypothetical protein
MKNKKAVMQDYLVWIIIAIAVVILGVAILSKENNFLSGFLSNLKTKLRFGF